MRLSASLHTKKTLHLFIDSFLLKLSGDEQKELMKSEMSDLQRLIRQEQFEKEAAQKTADDLRTMVKKAEADKVELSRVLQDERHKNAGIMNCCVHRLLLFVIFK